MAKSQLPQLLPPKLLRRLRPLPRQLLPQNLSRKSQLRPLRIPRGPDRQSINLAGLYPAGEGAGYAGVIMSAAVDGIETAEALAMRLLPAAS